MEPKPFSYVIIGAGPTGIGAAHRLKTLGKEFIVLEQAPKAGGLASSFVDDKGFTWDIGGHVQFSHYPYFDELMRAVGGESEWLTHRRSAWAWLRGRFVPYPVQNHLRYLPPGDMWRCLRGIMALQAGRGAPRDFREWILATFGQGLAGLFMIPYNFKVWACPPEDMAYQWIGERVAVTSLKEALKNILLRRDDIAWGPNSLFRFPARGGTGGIWERAAALVGREHFVFGCRVREIDTAKKEIRCEDGTAYRYQHLISTMPVSLLARMLRPALPEAVLAAAGDLRYASSNIVGLGLNGRCPHHLAGKSWMYFPEGDCPFYRATVFSNYSPANVPDPEKYWSLMTETSESPQKPVDHAALIEETILGCLNTGLIGSRDDIYSVWQHRVEHGYPVPSLRRDTILAEVMPALEALGIYSRGRFGGWKYEVSNQDHSLMQGVEAANRLALGEPEKVYPLGWMG